VSKQAVSLGFVCVDTQYMIHSFALTCCNSWLPLVA